MNKNLSKLFIPILMLGCIALGLLGWQFFPRDDERLDKAYTFYLEGESAKTVALRKKSFNQALDAYLDLEKSDHPNFGNGKLQFNIANSYFQLEEYAEAILYYDRARVLMPREEKVERNLQLAQDKLGVPHDSTMHAFALIFFLNTYLSLPERLQLFLVLGLLLIGFGSAYLWNHRLWLKRLTLFLCVLFGLMGLNLIYTRYFTPIDAILISSYDLRKDAGTQYAKVNKTPLLAGSKVEVFSVLADGSWVKILTQSGEIGYVPQDVIRVVGP